MCGIAGFCDFNNRSSEPILTKMTDVLVHRGPDGKGYYFHPAKQAQIGLGHRRLSIIDLSENGAQPMHFHHLSMVFNGEIYNFQEIKNELQDQGNQFKSNSDTEVVLQLFAQKGIEAIHQFIGMFAFALFDQKANKLYLFRDRAGVKPLFYYYHNGLLLFASELKALQQHPEFEKKIDYNSLSFYFKGGYIPAPHSIFQNCKKLKPGHYLEIDLKSQELKEKCYWEVLAYYNQPPKTISEQTVLDEMEKLMVSAFNYRMVSDVPVGLFLSGGYDSTAVAALLQCNRTEQIKTFTIGFDQPSFDEAPYAKKVAEYLNTDHHEYYCTTKDAQEILPLLPEYFDEPFGDSSAIPTILVSRFARKHVTVSLSADGGDELFAGYGKYFTNDRYFNTLDKIPFYLREKLIPAANLFRSLRFVKNIDRKVDVIKEMLAEKEVARLKIKPRVFYSDTLQSLMKVSYDDIHSGFDDFDLLNGNTDSLNRLLAVDYKTYMVDDILVKVDRATMSTSLEGREPLLDHRLVEFYANVPGHIKYQNNDPKYILKKIVDKYVPKAIMDRKKMGFGIPLVFWFKQELKPYFMHYLDPLKIKAAGILNEKEVSRLLSEYLNASRNGDQYNEFLFTRLWYILCFEMWREKWM